MDAPLRVALDITPLAGEPTGIARAVSGVLHSLCTRDDLKVSGWMLTGRNRAIPFDIPDQVSIHHCPIPPRALHPSWARLPLPRGHLIHGPADVVHGMNYVVPPTGIPTVLTVQDASIFTNPEWYDSNVRGFARLVRKAIERGCWIHVSTHSVAEALTAYCHIPQERLAVIGYGIPEIKPGDKANGERIAGSPRYILALGSVNQRKGIPELVEAFEMISNPPRDLRLVIAGLPGLDEDRLKTTIANMSDPSCVTRISRLDDSQRSDLLQGASILAYPSFDEGFGFPPLEAMSLGTPVVASTGGSIPEVVGDAALLASPGNIQELATALAKALEDPLRSDLINRGYKKITDYSWELTAIALSELYHRAATAK